MIRISRPTTCANQIAMASRMPRSHVVQTNALGSYGTPAMRLSASARCHQFSVVGTDNCSIERAFQLLRVLLLGKVAPRESKLAARNEPGLARLEHHRETTFLRLRTAP